jgi:hypothetical protein
LLDTRRYLGKKVGNLHTSRQKLLDDKLAGSTGSSDDKDMHDGLDVVLEMLWVETSRLDAIVKFSI